MMWVLFSRCNVQVSELWYSRVMLDSQQTKKVTVVMGKIIGTLIKLIQPIWD